jgi:hypothetical protein
MIAVALMVQAVWVNLAVLAENQVPRLATSLEQYKQLTSAQSGPTPK